MWAHVGTDGVGGISRSSGTESEHVGHAEQTWCAGSSIQTLARPYYITRCSINHVVLL
jgi:hypothetical protein